MTTAHQIESNANYALSGILQPMLGNCIVRAEQTQTVAGHPGMHPDVLVTASGRSPVVVEAEYEPAGSVEKDACDRLGFEVEGEARIIEAVVALRYPQSVGAAHDLHTAVAEAELSYCVHYDDGTRFPETGWLQGTVADLADLIRLVSVPRKDVDQAADDLQKGIDSASAVLNQLAQTHPDVNPAIARHLGMADVPQMRRMACSIIANALLFHERLAGRHGIKPVQNIFVSGGPNPHAEILAAWQDILKVNYLDIFEVARAILIELPTQEASRILNLIGYYVLDIASKGINNDHDLTGRVFQRLIADRKYLATFYTLPSSAALLARLAVSKLQGVNWADPVSIGQLRIADFACGTGALLSAVAEQISSNHERTGGIVANLHAILLESVLYGCDVMPSAIHITGSTLAGLQPTVEFNHTNLHALPYGRQANGEVAIGSLELLDPGSSWSMTMPDESFDLIIMNPPFTRNVTREGAYAGTINAAFAAFGASETDQRDMAERLSRIKIGSCYHGNAGMASAFAALADRKLKPGGILALVLPLSVAAGLSWQAFRKLQHTAYCELDVISIGANGSDMSFSSDTGMAECLVLGRKVDAPPTTTGLDDAPNTIASPSLNRFVTLECRPRGFANAAALAKGLAERGHVRSIAGGAYGGTPLVVGDDKAGEMLNTPETDDAEIWGSVRVCDYSLAQSAYGLSRSTLCLPGLASVEEIAMANLEEVGELGLYDLDVSGPPPRAPFAKEAPSSSSSYPCLWNHNAKRETRLVVEPDSQLRVRQGLEAKAAHVWSTASRCHLNRDFTFGSQACSVAFTNRPSAGGRVWPNVIFPDERFDFACSIWSNCTLGLLCYWWHATRQQSSKATITLRSADTLPVLDLREFTDSQLRLAEAIFDEFRDLEFKPAYLADADPNRALLDRRVVCDLLGFDQEIYRAVRLLSAKWCAEPSVHGGKARPKSASLIV